jgi:hypothetical protein
MSLRVLLYSHLQSSLHEIPWATLPSSDAFGKREAVCDVLQDPVMCKHISATCWPDFWGMLYRPIGEKVSDELRGESTPLSG